MSYTQSKLKCGRQRDWQTRSFCLSLLHVHMEINPRSSQSSNANVISPFPASTSYTQPELWMQVVMRKTSVQFAYLRFTFTQKLIPAQFSLHTSITVYLSQPFTSSMQRELWSESDPSGLSYFLPLLPLFTSVFHLASDFTPPSIHQQSRTWMPWTQDRYVDLAWNELLPFLPISQFFLFPLFLTFFLLSRFPSLLSSLLPFFSFPLSCLSPLPRRSFPSLHSYFSPSLSP